MNHSKTIHLVILVVFLVASMGLLHTEKTYAHEHSNDVILNEAYFYGVPTFNLTSETDQDSEISRQREVTELENMRRQFWGISIR